MRTHSAVVVTVGVEVRVGLCCGEGVMGRGGILLQRTSKGLWKGGERGKLRMEGRKDAGKTYISKGGTETMRSVNCTDSKILGEKQNRKGSKGKKIKKKKNRQTHKKSKRVQKS